MVEYLSEALEVEVDPVKVGELVFDFDVIDRYPCVTVTKETDLEGWVTFIRCPEDEMAWGNLRNNSFPLNGTSIPALKGVWIIYEYVGRDGSSLNLDGERAPKGFSKVEVASLRDVVQLMFTKEEMDRAAKKRLEEESSKDLH